MTSPWIEALISAIDNLAALIAFFYVLLGGFVTLLLIALFGALAIRGMWRWCTGNSWNSAIASVERKALH